MDVGGGEGDESGEWKNRWGEEEQQCSRVRERGGEVVDGRDKERKGEGMEEGRVRGQERWCVVARQRLITKSPSILPVLPCPPCRPELHTQTHTHPHTHTNEL